MDSFSTFVQKNKEFEALAEYFSGFNDSDFMLESHPLSGMVAKKYAVVKPPKTVGDLIDMTRNVLGSLYTNDGKHEIRKYGSSISITDLTNAMKTGKKVEKYYVGHYDSADLSNFLYEFKNLKFDEFLRRIKIDTLKESAPMELRSGAESDYNNNIASKNVFSPFAVGNLKRLTTLPKKPTIRHIMRLIANGQYKVLVRDYSYTDDYLNDAANNYGKGDVNPIDLLKDMVEHKYSSPWANSRVINGEELLTYNFGPHTNESYTLVPDLKGKLRVRA